MKPDQAWAVGGVNDRQQDVYYWLRHIGMFENRVLPFLWSFCMRNMIIYQWKKVCVCMYIHIYELIYIYNYTHMCIYIYTC